MRSEHTKKAREILEKLLDECEKLDWFVWMSAKDKVRDAMYSIECAISKLEYDYDTLAVRSQRARDRTRIHNPADDRVRGEVLKLSRYRCFYCGEDLRFATDNFHVDHLVAKCAGGPDHLANFVASCAPCNRAKRVKHVAEFVAERSGNA